MSMKILFGYFLLVIPIIYYLLYIVSYFFPFLFGQSSANQSKFNFYWV